MSPSPGAYSAALGRPWQRDEAERVNANLKALKKARKRAGKGERSLWAAEDQRRLQDGPHYDRDELLVGDMRRLHIADVPRPDTLTKAAERAREGVRHHRAKPIFLADPAEVLADFERVTVPVERLFGGARLFANAASRAGCDVYAGQVLQDDIVTSQVVLAIGDSGRVRATWPTNKVATARVVIQGVAGAHDVNVTTAKKFITEGTTP